MAWSPVFVHSATCQCPPTKYQEVIPLFCILLSLLSEGESLHNRHPLVLHSGMKVTLSFKSLGWLWASYGVSYETRKAFEHRSSNRLCICPLRISSRSSEEVTTRGDHQVVNIFGQSNSCRLSIKVLKDRRLHWWWAYPHWWNVQISVMMI